MKFGNAKHAYLLHKFPLHPFALSISPHPITYKLHRIPLCALCASAPLR